MPPVRYTVLSALASLSLLTAVSAAQAPPVQNAQVTSQAASTGLERTFKALVARQTSAAWIGYAVAMVGGRQRACCGGDEWGCCRLEEGHGGVALTNLDSGVELEAGKGLLVLFRAEAGQVQRIRSFSGNCRLDAGGLAFHWLTEVRPAESVALLASLVEESEENHALAAIALHADASADAALERFVDPTRPEWLREKASFWLGAARGRAGYEGLRRMLREDPSDEVRRKVVFALSVSPEPEAIDRLIEAARSDRSAGVRGQALFWLAHKAGEKAASAIKDAVEQDPELDVKKRAVFALSQLPREKGVPLLIQVARTHRHPEVRKKALFWLGQSNDPRALAFFEEILKP